jgi:very-short-patch-repair endonuclease
VPTAVLSHGSAAALWRIGPERSRVIQISTRGRTPRRRPGVRVHRRSTLRTGDIDLREGIPVTGVVQTLVDLATELGEPQLERAVNEADRLDLIDPEALRTALEYHRGHRGIAPLRRLLDHRIFRLTDSELERRFLVLVRDAGLPIPLTGQRLNGFNVDFHWPDLGLVVETDGLRYHRTPAQQARDRRRDQAHTAAGLTALRFTAAQVHFEADQVLATLTSVVRRLS